MADTIREKAEVSSVQVDGLVGLQDATSVAAINLQKAKALARHTESLAATKHWGVDDQDTLEWLIAEVDRLQNEVCMNLE